MHDDRLSADIFPLKAVGGTRVGKDLLSNGQPRPVLEGVPAQQDVETRWLSFENIRGVLAHSAAVADGPVLGGLDQPEAGCAVLPLVDRGAGVGGGEGRVRGEDPREEGAEGGAGARHHLQGVAAAHCNTGEMSDCKL